MLGLWVALNSLEEFPANPANGMDFTQTTGSLLVTDMQMKAVSHIPVSLGDIRKSKSLSHFG